MHHPKVSVIIPVYNREKLVAETIESCLAQTHPNIEVIAVDDCSKDGTLQTLQALAAKDDRVKVVHSVVNMGLCITRNIGAAHATGEWFWFLDSDDLLMPNAVETLLEAMLSRNLQMASSGEHGFWDVDLEVIRQRLADLPPVPEGGAPDFPLWGYWPNKGFSFTSVLWKKELYSESGGFRPLIKACDEADMFFKLLLRHPDLRVLPWPNDLLLKRFDNNSMACEARRGETPWLLVMTTAVADLYLTNPTLGSPEVRRYLFDLLYTTAAFAHRNGQTGLALQGLAKWRQAQLPIPKLRPAYHHTLHRLLGFCKAEGVLALARKILGR